MRTYLNEHDSQSAYENFLSTREDEDFPRVDYIKSTKEVIYNSMPYDYSKDYLTFKALEDGTFTLTIPSQVDTNYLTSVSYSTDNGSTWVTTQNDATEKVITTPSITTGNTILWKGSGISTSITGDTPYVSKFSSTGAFDIEGNIMSMLYGDNFANQTTLPSNSTNFRNLFNGSDIVDASNLKLPATTLTVDCYRGMLGSCTSLTTMPDLPAMNLADSCYFSLFSGCSSLTNIVSQLPATTLANNCYRAMFQQCSSLTTIPTDLLPATTMMDLCYRNMFRGCTSLEIAPELPATILASNCYNCMFYGCAALTTAPELPATTLASYCYQYMFKDCTSLTTAPELPATTLTSRCYESMFQNCSNLNYIKAMFTTAPSTSYTRDWVSGVAATGTFVKNSAATWNVTGTSGVPSGWTVQTAEYSWPEHYDYFTTEAIENSVFTFSIPSDISTLTLSYVEYSTDNGQTWVKTNNVNNQQVTITTPTITAGNSVKWRCAASALSASSKRSTFSSSGRYNVSGNVMSLVGCASGFSSTYALKGLFYNSTNLVSAVNLSLPATTLAQYCYREMFYGCTALTTAPVLPATTLASNCYDSMFSRCTALTTAPVLPATTLAQFCYYGMFGGCTALTTAPVLPATTLADSCYEGMFQGCTSLTTAPELPVTTLADSCYEGMFQGCTSLTTAPTLPATTSGWRCYFNMFNGCTALTTAPELPATTLASYCYGSMFNGCTSLTTAPVLPATTLVNSCYYYMFNGCSNLNYIKAMFTTTPSTTYTSSWVSGVAASGTFVKNSAAQWDVTGTSGVPSGWTVQTATE